MESDRPDWDQYFMTIAKQVETRSTCLRRQVGAVLVKDKRILATGYNGAPRNLKHCAEIGCERKKQNIPSGERHELCRALHAEMNVLLQCAIYGVSAEHSTLYCTNHPCSLCAKMLINAGIVRIVISNDYPDELAKSLLREANINIELLQII